MCPGSRSRHAKVATLDKLRHARRRVTHLDIRLPDFLEEQPDSVVILE